MPLCAGKRCKTRFLGEMGIGIYPKDQLLWCLTAKRIKANRQNSRNLHKIQLEMYLQSTTNLVEYETKYNWKEDCGIWNGNLKRKAARMS